jgi:hypothetical protein
MFATIEPKKEVKPITGVLRSFETGICKVYQEIRVMINSASW